MIVGYGRLAEILVRRRDVESGRACADGGGNDDPAEQVAYHLIRGEFEGGGELRASCGLPLMSLHVRYCTPESSRAKTKGRTPNPGDGRQLFVERSYDVENSQLSSDSVRSTNTSLNSRREARLFRLSTM